MLWKITCNFKSWKIKIIKIIKNKGVYNIETCNIFIIHGVWYWMIKNDFFSEQCFKITWSSWNGESLSNHMTLRYRIDDNHLIGEKKPASFYYIKHHIYWNISVLPGTVLSNINPSTPPTNIAVLSKTVKTWSTSWLP